MDTWESLNRLLMRAVRCESPKRWTGAGSRSLTGYSIGKPEALLNRARKQAV